MKRKYNKTSKKDRENIYIHQNKWGRYRAECMINGVRHYVSSSYDYETVKNKLIAFWDKNNL